MSSTYAAIQMAAVAVAARACLQLGHGKGWSSFVSFEMSRVNTTTTDPNGTKRPTRRLEKRLT